MPTIHAATRLRRPTFSIVVGTASRLFLSGAKSMLVKIQTSGSVQQQQLNHQLGEEYKLASESSWRTSKVNFYFKCSRWLYWTRGQRQPEVHIDIL